MARIYIDGKPYDVPEHQNLLHVCLSLGFNLPYFCWHPAMHSVGACRQCAVKQFKDENDTKGRIVMACMTQAADGTRISIDDPEAREFRAAVTEFLMVNHPHDCPVCDEGGECHLQDMTVMTGHNYRQYHFDKRTHRNQYLGPLINHEMNRCIACYRCVRYYRDYAGGRDFDVFGWHNHVYFGRQTDGVLESEFSGNLVEICPTGVFTDKTFKKRYARKWDLQTAPSICVHCGLGCNTLPAERYGTLRRTRNRYHSQINGYFLCDRGRFGYEFVNSPKRLRGPEIRTSAGTLEPVDKHTAIARLAELGLDRSKLIGIGSPRASLESNFALRTLVGPDRFFCGLSDTDCRATGLILQILRTHCIPTASLQLAECSDAQLILGEDVAQTAPRLALALRQATLTKEIELAGSLHIPTWEDAAVREAIQQERGPCFIATPAATRLDDVATQAYCAAPDDIARLGFGVAHALDPTAPGVDDLPDDARRLVDRIAEAFRESARPLVVTGAACGSPSVLQAAANVAEALRAAGKHEVKLCFAVPECNTVGMAMMTASNLAAARQALETGAAETLIILENDLYRRADTAAVDALLSAAKHVVVLDSIVTPTVERAEIALPAATFAEADGTLVNNEGRAQRHFRVFAPQGDVQQSWQWLGQWAAANGHAEAETYTTLDALLAAMAEAIPDLDGVKDAAPPATFRAEHQRIPRQPHRYSGRTAMHADVSVHDQQPPGDADSALAFSMEGYPGQPPAALITHYWAPGWNSVQALNHYQQEIEGPLRGGDPGSPLIAPAAVGDASYFDSPPAAFAPRQGHWLLVPLPHIFGSEELSMLAPAIAELAPAAYVAIHPDDASRLGVSDGEQLDVLVGDTPWRLPVKCLPSLALGVAGVPAGLPGVPPLTAPTWVILRKPGAS